MDSATLLHLIADAIMTAAVGVVGWLAKGKFEGIDKNIDTAKVEMAEGVRALRGDVKEMSAKLGGHGEDIAQIKAVQLSHDARLTALERKGRR